jgi:hypothetical protein
MLEFTARQKDSREPPLKGRTLRSITYKPTKKLPRNEIRHPESMFHAYWITGILVPFPNGTINFPSLQSVPWGPPSLLFNGYQGLKPLGGGGGERPGCETDHSPPSNLVPKLWMSGAIPPLPHMPSWCAHERYLLPLCAMSSNFMLRSPVQHTLLLSCTGVQPAARHVVLCGSRPHL